MALTLFSFLQIDPPPTNARLFDRRPRAPQMLPYQPPHDGKRASPTGQKAPIRSSGIAKPEKITVVPQLPKTRSGKIMRRVLRARALGLPEGDLTTLEE